MGYVEVWSSETAGTFDIPFRCAQCGHATQARVRAMGHARTAIEHHRVEAMAQQAAYGHAFRAVTESPCPRCQGPSTTLAERLAEWERKARTRKTLRLVLGAVGLVLLFASSAGCASLYDDLAQAGPGVGIWTTFWGVILLGILLLLGPGKSPRRQASPWVQFA
jgi:ribosomal protein L37E